MSWELYPWVTDEWVAEQGFVNREVYRHAYTFAIRWKMAMNSHSRTGRFRDSISVERAFKGKDYWVVADVEYASWAEYGHQGWVWDPVVGDLRWIGYVRGIHVLRSLL